MKVDSKKIGIDVRLWKETGIGRYIRNLVLNLGEFDKDNTYVFFAKRSDFEEIKRSAKNVKFELITCEIPWHSVKEQFEFPRLLNKYNLDLMHFPYFSVPAFYNKPFVVTVHDLIINHFPTGQATTLPLPFYLIKKMGYSVVIKNAIVKSKKILVPSKATKQEILDHYAVGDDKVHITPEGVDTDIIHFKPVIFKEKNPYFLYVGNAYPHKNVERLIDAFQIFSEKHPEYILRLVGKKDFFYKRLIEKVKTPNVEFMGYVNDSDLAKLYKYSRATFVPSLMEGFGLPALEAMAVGCLVVASDIPAFREVCSSSAIYFDPNNRTQMKDIFKNILSMSENKKEVYITKGKNQAKKFSWDIMVQQTREVYESSIRI